MATYTSSISTKASPEQVFAALTKPELVKLWQYGKVLATDWQEGGDIRFTAEYEGKTLEQWGTVLEVRTNELVKYNLFTPRPNLADTAENRCITTYMVTSDNGVTNIEIIQEDNRPNIFVPQTFKGILAALREIAEAN
jgi:uncharacterized protein YndB with AHSA1/START domain